jgi:hypothetical protein
MGHQRAKYIIIHCCSLAAASHTLRDNLSYIPDYRQLVTTLKSLKKVIREVTLKEILGPYQ